MQLASMYAMMYKKLVGKFYTKSFCANYKSPYVVALISVAYNKEELAWHVLTSGSL